MAQLTPIRGFVNVPVTKSICTISTIFTLVVSLFQYHDFLKLIVAPFVIEYGQYWRILTFQLSVANESEYVLITFLWFYYKAIERFFGSRKYLSLLLLFALYNAVICFLVISLGQLLENIVIHSVFKPLKGEDKFIYKTTFLNAVSSGPLGIISSLYIAYGTYVPTSYYWTILLRKEKLPLQRTELGSSINKKGRIAITLSNHFFIYILYTLLLFNNGIESIIPCLVGLIIGKLYSHDLLPGTRNWLLPSTFFKAFVAPRKFVAQLPQRFRRQHSDGFEPIDHRPDTILQTTDNQSETDDDPEDVDEVRNEGAQIRAETPVRPLGSQFLDTFRT